MKPLDSSWIQVHSIFLAIMSPIGLDAASFLGCVLESIGFGVLTIMVGFTSNTMLGKKRTPQRLMATVLLLIWIFSAAHWIVNVYRAFQAFMRFPEGPVAFYNTLDLPSYTARNSVYLALTLVADSFAVYRCYLVWDRKWHMAIFPALLLMGTAVTGGGVTYTFTKVPPGNVVFIAKAVPWITSYISMTLATNVVCTCLIAYRIIRSQMTMRKFKVSSIGKNQLWSSLIIIMESAAIYSSVLVVLLVCYLSESNAQYIMLDMTVSSIGITFTMIIFRVTIGATNDGRLYGTTTSSGSMRLPTSRPGDLSVNVTRLVEVNRDKYSSSGAREQEEPDANRKSPDGIFEQDGKSHLQL